jgi:hypothetical protein
MIEIDDCFNELLEPLIQVFTDNLVNDSAESGFRAVVTTGLYFLIRRKKKSLKVEKTIKLSDKDFKRERSLKEAF